MMALQEVAKSVPGVAEGRFDRPLGAAHHGRRLGDAEPSEVEAIDGETLPAREARDRAGEVELVVDGSDAAGDHPEQRPSTGTRPPCLIGSDGKEPCGRSASLRIEL